MALQDARQSLLARDETTAEAAEAVLKLGSFPSTVVEIFVSSSGAATFEIFGSADNINWRKTGEIVLAGAGESAQGYNNAYSFVKVSTTAANDNFIEIVASGG